MMRYVVRHEFFGGLIYDRKCDMNIVVDEEFFELLKNLFSCGLKDKSKFSNDDYSFLEDEEFIKSGNLNYRLIDSSHYDETLSAPGRVHFYYTSKCNLDCTHCFTKLNKTNREMSFEEKMDMLDQMYDLGVNEILIGGGEPFIETDFPDFVEECLKRNIVTKVFTNGLLLNDKSLVDRISHWNLKYMSISIDGANDDEYEIVRGVKGLSLIKNNLQMLKEKCSFTIAASITVNSYNCLNAWNILGLIDNMGFDRLKVRPVKPAGNVFNNEQVVPTAEQYAHFIREAQEIWNKKYKSKFTLDFSWGDTRLFYDEESNQVRPLNIVYPYEGYGCFAGKVNIVFDSAGNAITCGFLPDELAKSDSDNLKDKTLKEIWDSGQKFLNLRNLSGNKACLGCDYYPICRGGCMARNLFEEKDINNPDPWCLKKHFPIQLSE